MQPQNRIDGDRTRIGSLAHTCLRSWLSGGTSTIMIALKSTVLHPNRRPFLQAAPLFVARFDLRELGERTMVAIDAELREVSEGRLNLTTSADPAPAAHRIQSLRRSCAPLPTESCRALPSHAILKA